MFKDKKIAILGFGIEGKDSAAYLLKQGAKVTVFDLKTQKELDFSKADRTSISFSLGEAYLKGGLYGFDYIFRSPGVYRYLPEIVDAEAKGVKVLSAAKLFFDICPSKIIGVTGTKGKGTTASLIYEILKRAGNDVYLAGNIGVPFLKLLPKLTEESWVVLELSSFQLIDMDASPHIAVVLNITEDHLDWHKDIKEYIDSKKNIVKHQKNTDYAVICADYEIPKSFAGETEAKVVFFSKSQLEDKYKKNLLLRGEHNWENVQAAILVAGILKIQKETILDALSVFKGLKHRLEPVGSLKEISFYNDSFATGPQPTIAAIRSFNEPLTLILGGSEKGLKYQGLGEEIAEAKNINLIILIGQVGPKIEMALKKAGYQGKIIDKGRASMSEIVKEAFLNTPEGGVILLSPAAASFDMFKDYKDRGRKFKAAVKALG